LRQLLLGLVDAGDIGECDRRLVARDHPRARASKGDGLVVAALRLAQDPPHEGRDRKSTRLNSSHVSISYAVFCLKKKKNTYKTAYLPYTYNNSEQRLLPMYYYFCWLLFTIGLLKAPYHAVRLAPCARLSFF